MSSAQVHLSLQEMCSFFYFLISSTISAYEEVYANRLV